MKYNKYITDRGYILRKEGLPFNDIKKIKKDLLVSPAVNSSYGAKACSFPIYMESTKKIYLPLHYGIDKFGKADNVTISKGTDINIEFSGTLRDKQKPAYESFINQCALGEENLDFSYKSNGGIISLPCGYGKTILSLYLIWKLKKKALVIVHKEFLVNQWKERIEEFLPDAKVGTIQGSTFDIEGKDIVLGMLQSISMKEYEDNAFFFFCFTIIDECHHIAAEVFSRALPKINSYYNLGLSATPKRKDGLSKVFHWYLGPMIYEVKQRENTPIQINTLFYKSNDRDYNKEELNYMNKICAPKMINKITENGRRTHIIIQVLKKLLAQNRKILVLSDRRNHLTDIFNIINSNKIATIGYYVGGMKQEDLKKSENNQILLGTYSMSSEGMDIPELNSVVFASPKSDIIQSIGRILRKQHPETPVAWDIVDDGIQIFKNQYKKRQSYYKKMKYNITNFYIEDEIERPIEPFYSKLDQPSSQPVKKKKNILSEYAFQNDD